MEKEKSIDDKLLPADKVFSEREGAYALLDIEDLSSPQKSAAINILRSLVELGKNRISELVEFGLLNSGIASHANATDLRLKPNQLDKSYQKYLGYISRRQPHHNYLIEGDRGVGKTTLLLTLRRYTAHLGGRDQNPGDVIADAGRIPTITKDLDDKIGLEEPYTILQGLDLFLPMPIVIPENIQPGESILEQVFTQVLDRLDRTISVWEESHRPRDQDSLKIAQKLRDDLVYSVCAGWMFSKQDGSDVITQDCIDRLEFSEVKTEYLQLSHARLVSWRRFVSDYLNFSRTAMLVIFIDDTDLAPETINDIQKTMRMYFAHPRICVVLSASMPVLQKTLTRIRLNEEQGALNVLSNRDRKSHIDLIENESAALLGKVLPGGQRTLISYRLKDFNPSLVPDANMPEHIENFYDFCKWISSKVEVSDSALEGWAIIADKYNDIVHRSIREIRAFVLSAMGSSTYDPLQALSTVPGFWRAKELGVLERDSFLNLLAQTRIIASYKSGFEVSFVSEEDEDLRFRPPQIEAETPVFMYDLIAVSRNYNMAGYLPAQFLPRFDAQAIRQTSKSAQYIRDMKIGSIGFPAINSAAGAIFPRNSLDLCDYLTWFNEESLFKGMSSINNNFAEFYDVLEHPIPDRLIGKLETVTTVWGNSKNDWLTHNRSLESFGNGNYDGISVEFSFLKDAWVVWLCYLQWKKQINQVEKIQLSEKKVIKGLEELAGSNPELQGDFKFFAYHLLRAIDNDYQLLSIIYLTIERATSVALRGGLKGSDDSLAALTSTPKMIKADIRGFSNRRLLLLVWSLVEAVPTVIRHCRNRDGIKNLQELKSDLDDDWRAVMLAARRDDHSSRFEFYGIPLPKREEILEVCSGCFGAWKESLEEVENRLDAQDAHGAQLKKSGTPVEIAAHQLGFDTNLVEEIFAEIEQAQNAEF